ncbi:MAG: FAD-dependent oxidoreductase [Methylotenera sp.]|nr:FAD-dependent oxidoreductase [Oligoflexia bacterium]
MLTPTVFEVTFEPTIMNPKPGDPGEVTFKAGQFVSVVVPGAGPKGRDLRRAYSIASAPESKPIELCVKLVEGGPGTNYLYGLRAGDTFKGYAPYGTFIFTHRPQRHACFISTGTGIAPFRSMIRSESYQQNKPLSTTLLLGVREENELLYTHEFGNIDWVEFIPAVSRPIDAGAFKGLKGRVTDHFRHSGEHFPWLETDYYLCGSGAMIDEIKMLLTARGVVKESIHVEVYYKPPKDPVVADAPVASPEAADKIGT